MRATGDVWMSSIFMEVRTNAGSSAISEDPL